LNLKLGIGISDQIGRGDFGIEIPSISVHPPLGIEIPRVFGIPRTNTTFTEEVETSIDEIIFSTSPNPGIGGRARTQTMPEPTTDTDVGLGLVGLPFPRIQSVGRPPCPIGNVVLETDEGAYIPIGSGRPAPPCSIDIESSRVILARATRTCGASPCGLLSCHLDEEGSALWCQGSTHSRVGLPRHSLIVSLKANIGTLSTEQRIVRLKRGGLGSRWCWLRSRGGGWLRR